MPAEQDTAPPAAEKQPEVAVPATEDKAEAAAAAPAAEDKAEDAAAAPASAENKAEDAAPAAEEEKTDAAAPASEQKKEEEQAAAPAAEKKPETPFSKFAARLPEITKSADHGEMWGVELADAESHVPTKVVLQKFLRANNGDAAAAENQLTSALQWRKKLEPAKLAEERTFDEKAFGGLGYVTVHKDDQDKETVITWNVYGAVKDNKKTFGNVDEFIKWRAALMELGVRKLNLNSVREPIPDGGHDPYQMVQVHDYLSVSFFRMDPHVKSASKETIQTFSMAYPELLAHKYFVNVPTIMGWMYAAMKLFLAPATLKKFHPMSSGTTLATELTGIVSSLPKEYGGKGESVKEQGQTVKMETAKEGIPKESPEAPVAAGTEPKGDKPAEETEADEAKAADETGAEESSPAEEPKDDKPADEAKAAEEKKTEEPKAEDKPTGETKGAA